MRIALTGGSGLLALNWAASFAMREAEDDSVCLALHQRKITTSLGATCVADLSSPDAAARWLEGCQADVVIHAAALTNVDQCEVEPDLARQINTDMAGNVAQACARTGVRMVLMSTDHLFDGRQPLLDEEAPPAPVNVYAHTKAAAETLARKHLPDALILRTNFFGWGPSYRMSFSDMVIRKLRANQPVSLFTDAFVTPILVSEVAQGCLDLLKQGESGVFNLVGDTRLSKHAFGMILAETFDLPLGLIRAARLQDRVDLVARPLDMSLSNAKTCAALGRPIGGLSDGCIALLQQEHHRAIQEVRAL